MADSYADLDTLAAKGDGRLWLCVDARVWSYGGAPLDTRATSLRVPVENVPDARVQAALAAGAWAVAVIDNLASPVRILAVRKAPEAGPAPRPLTPVDLGSAAAA